MPCRVPLQLPPQFFVANTPKHPSYRNFSATLSRESASRAATNRYWQTPAFAYTVKMSSAGLGAGIGSAGLYAVVSNPAQVGAKPEEAAELKHHLKNGKGFRNPWDSFGQSSTPGIIFAMIWYVLHYAPLCELRTPALHPCKVMHEC